MNMTQSKMSWNGSVWTLSTGDGTGTSIAHSMTTVTKVLSALTMAGFAVSQVVQEDTSIALQGTKYAPDIARRQFLALNKPMQTGQTSGSAWTHYNPMSRAYHTLYSTSSVGESSLEDLESQQESLYRISTITEDELSSFRYDIQREVRDALHSPQDALRQYTERNVLDWLNDTCVSQRGAETPSSSGCAEFQQSPCRVHHQGDSYGTSEEQCWREVPCSSQSQTRTRRGCFVSSCKITHSSLLNYVGIFGVILFQQAF